MKPRMHISLNDSRISVGYKPLTEVGPCNEYVRVVTIVLCDVAEAYYV